MFITYDPACSARSVSAIESNAQTAINEWAVASKVNNFNSSFSLAKFQKAITLADKCISDVSTQVSLLKYINPKAAETNTYCISTGAPIYDSAPGKTSNADGCVKEPVIVSGRFRLSDRPTVDQYFEDDGFGNLRTYYNSGNRKVITNSSAGNNPAVIRFFARLGQEVTEDMAQNTQNNRLSVSPLDAKDEIAKIMADNTHSYHKGDETAVEKVRQLHEKAYGN